MYRSLRNSLLWMPDVIIRPTRDSDDARQECEDLARAMRDQGFESEIEVPGAEEVALGFVDLVVQVTERASGHALDELVGYFTQHGWKKVREAQEHQGVSSKGSAHRIVMITVGGSRTVMERSER
jgi:hypothetical protein